MPYFLIDRSGNTWHSDSAILQLRISARPARKATGELVGKARPGRALEPNRLGSRQAPRQTGLLIEARQFQ